MLRNNENQKIGIFLLSSHQKTIFFSFGIKLWVEQKNIIHSFYRNR